LGIALAVIGFLLIGGSTFFLAFVGLLTQGTFPVEIVVWTLEVLFCATAVTIVILARLGNGRALESAGPPTQQVAKSEE